MGTQPSSPARASTETATSVKAATSTRGLTNDETSKPRNVVIDEKENGVEMIATSDEDSEEFLDARDSEEVDSDDSDSDDDEDDDDEDDVSTDLFLAKAEIFEDAERLKFFAVAMMHPEKPVAVGPYAQARCFFQRPSAPGVWTLEESEEMSKVLDDAKALKKQARKFMHPEDNVKADASVGGRNFFARPSAPEVETKEDADERAQIMEDAAKLKQMARFYLHPEGPVETSDPNCFGRNFFDRPSATAQETELEALARAQVLADAADLKKLARHFLHPEDKVVTTDPTCYGRNFFERPSATKVETLEEEEEKAEVLADAARLKKLARDYLHPEDSVIESDPMSFGRCYFDRPSAPEQETKEEAQARAEALADAANLKQLARNYLHPEESVVTSDPCLYGRNFFERASAPDAEFLEEAEERASILEDAAKLKRLARDYMHPEGVTTADGLCFGRNYFGRASAPEVDSVEEAEEKAMILADASRLRRLANDFHHPEEGVVCSDSTVFGRSYFDRPSAPEQETSEEAEARAEALADAFRLKKLAQDYLHPEKPVVTTDPNLYGRNYFDRPSAPERETREEAEARSEALADASRLKKLAQDYLHPEKPVVTTDPSLYGRNYFIRPSAPDVETSDEAEEKACIVEDAARLKKLARDHLHPEDPVITSDPTIFARSYFERSSAPDMETLEESTERAEILADANKLEKLARDYLHPEERVTTSDPASFGRNYFNRPSATEQETVEAADEQAQVVADAAALKTKAVEHLHPEVSVKTTDPTASGRNFFDRISSPDENIATYPPDDGYFVDDQEHVDYHGTQDTDLHFDLDEDEVQLEVLRKSLQSSFKVPSFQDYHDDEGHSDEEGENNKKDGENLSRSPSSVMLFGMDQPQQESSAH